MAKMKALMIGDAMIKGVDFGAACEKYLSDFVSDIRVGDWESDWGQLQKRRLDVEKQGPEIEDVDPLIEAEGADAELISGLFIPLSSKAFDAMPKLRLAGVARAGLENVNVAEATKRGILCFNVEGRNAEAVSDFAVGLMLCECRNMARAHYSIKNGGWQKEFANKAWVPELKEKTVGLVGFGYIGRLVAQKLSGFKVNLIVYDPFVSPEVLAEYNAKSVSKEELFSQADFVSIHARLTPETKGLVGKDALSLMKPTAYLINTGRAGLVDQAAITEALRDHKIAGAGLDVFWQEPLEADSELLSFDNVTLTTHIAGTTKEAFSRSPELLLEDIAKLLKGEQPRFIINKEVLDDPGFTAWLEGVK